MYAEAAPSGPGHGVRRLCAALGGGAAFGLLVSVATNIALLEISVNPAFAALIGLFLLPLGGLLCFRVLSFRRHVRGLPFVLCLSATCVVAGGLSILFNPSWFMELRPEYRGPLYATLGVALSFALSFSLVEVLNWCTASRQYPRAPLSALVSSPVQVLLLAVGSVMLGFVLGLLFGMSGVRLKPDATMKGQDTGDKVVVVVIGVVIGGVGAALNELLGAMATRAEAARRSPFAENDPEAVLQRFGRLLYSRPYTDDDGL